MRSKDAINSDVRRAPLRGAERPCGRRAVRPRLGLWVLGLGVAVAAGCGAHAPFSSERSGAQKGAAAQVDYERVQSATMSFAERYITAVDDVFDRIQPSLDSPEARLAALQGRIRAGLGALGNAVNQNPLVGLMDMTLMVSLTRETLSDPWAAEMYGAENVALVAAALKSQEAQVWEVAALFLTQGQLDELRRLVEEWRTEHPGQRFVGGAQLADFPQAKRTGAGGQGIVGSVFNIIRLDPFSGLDPAVAQIEESRLLAGRMFFYLRNMPTVLSWQTEALYEEAMLQPQVVRLFGDAGTVAEATTRFNDSARDFANASGRFADTVERFRAQLPEQQRQLMDQLNDMIARQRDEALKQLAAEVAVARDDALKQLSEEFAVARDEALTQASAEVAAQSKAAIEQLNTLAKGQQDLAAQNLQVVADRSIDRVYARARVVVLLGAGALLVALLLYRAVIAMLGLRRRPSGASDAPRP